MIVETTQKIAIGSDGMIYLEGNLTKFGVENDAQGTRLYEIGGDDVSMPQEAYSLRHGLPRQGFASREEFDQDFLRIAGAKQ